MPDPSDRRPPTRASSAFSLVEALLALGVTAGALLLVSAGLGPLMRLSGEAIAFAAADRAAEAVMAEDAIRRSRGEVGLSALAATASWVPPTNDAGAWWADRAGLRAAPVEDWRDAEGRLNGPGPAFAAATYVHGVTAERSSPRRRSLVVGWPAVDARGQPVPWSERRLRIWIAGLPP